MRFEGLAPALVATVGTLAAAALVLLATRGLRRPRRMVPFLELWQPEGTSRLGAGRPRTRRVHFAQLALQLTALMALLVAALAPALVEPATDVVILVDRSRSMRARRPDGRTRWEEAQERVGHVIDRLGADDRVAVIAFAHAPWPIRGLAPRGPHTRDVLETVGPSFEHDDLAAALELATRVLPERGRRRIVLIGDRDYDGVIGKAPPGVELFFQPVGVAAPNVVVSDAEVRATNEGAYEVEATVAALGGDANVELGVEPASVAGPLLASRRVRLADGSATKQAFTLPAAAFGRAAARIVARGPLPEDALAEDSESFALRVSRPRRRVLVVGATDLFVDGALLALGDEASVVRMREAPPAAALVDADAVIVSGTLPYDPPEGGGYLLLRASAPFASNGTVASPIVARARRDHPLLAGVSLLDLNIAEAARFVGVPASDAVVESFDAPLVIARETPGTRIVALAFEPRRSDLPLRTAFPVFVANAIEWLADRRARRLEPAPLASTRRTARAHGAPVILITPDGERSLAPGGGHVELPISVPGLYRTLEPGGGEAFVVAPGAPGESDLRASPRWSVAARIGASVGNRPRTADVALGLGLLLLVVEWIAFRRTLVRGPR